MGRVFFFIISLFCVCSVFGQAKAEFSTMEYNYGIIPYSKPAEAVIAVKNSGDKPLVINKVSTSCGCTVADWEKKAIKPGNSGYIKVKYDAMLMGHFFKEVSVYCNAAPYIFDIALIGEVSNTKVDYSKTHPFRIGDVLLDTGELLFDDVRIGHKYTKTISVVNIGEKPYSPKLMLLPSYLEVSCQPETLKQRQLGTISVTLDGDKLRTLGAGLIETSVYLARFDGDKICDDTNIPFSAFVLPEVKKSSDTDLANAPKFFITATEWNIDTEKKKRKYTKIIEIGNSGKSDLVIEYLQVSGRMVSVSLSSKVIKPGELAKLRITVKPKYAKRSRSGRIYIVTNDPNNPKEVVKVNL